MRRVSALLAILICGWYARCADASTANSSKVDISLTAQLGNSITLVVATPTVAFGVVTAGAVNTAPLGQTISVVSTWTLVAGNTVKLYAYFDSASAAMTGTLTGALIPVSTFTGSVNGGSGATFSQTNPFGGLSLALQMYSQTLTALTAVSTRTDTLALTMNLAGQGSLQADNYTGTMHLQAQAM